MAFYFINFSAVLDLRCCVRDVSSCAVLLTAVAALVVEHRLWGMWVSVVVVNGLSNCGSKTLELKHNS